MGYELAPTIVYDRPGRLESPRLNLRSVLLALLSKAPNTGYGLGRLLRQQLSHLWDARLQQIYGELARLQSDGLVEVECFDLPNRPAKKIYSLTPAGQQVLDEWLALPPAPYPCKDDLLVRLYCLERIPNDVLIRRLEERWHQYESEARELRRRLADAPNPDPAQLGLLLTLEAALFRAEGQASWCTKALSCIRNGRQAVPPSDGSQGRTPLRAAGG